MATSLSESNQEVLGLGADPAAPLVEELRRAWETGRPVRADEVLGRHPELRDDRQIALRLVYEEVCLIREGGGHISTHEVLALFPDLSGDLEVLLGCHALLECLQTPPSFPEVGERLGEFQLLAELGRGACGRVYLAAQPALADRPVVLKLTAHEGEEHLTLGRLQHAHIVPLYFVATWPERNLQGLCMPFLGGLSLEAVLWQLRDIPPALRTGRHLLDVVSKAGAPGGPREPSGSPVTAGSTRLAGPTTPAPVQRFLAGATFAEAMCWLAACLADALQYAHERGLAHLDIKPDNVLLAGDGQPMLLDFHLARGPIAPGKFSDRIGGTTGYMSPEQELALRAVRAGKPVPQAVDGRADIYALGALLYEALCGPLPLPGPAAVAGRLRTNPQVSPGLADILLRCLDSEPRRRYSAAADLAADLRRHLKYEPLHGVPNRSWRERWRKWRRRCGRSTTALGLAALAWFGVAVACWGRWTQEAQALNEARADLAEGRRQLQVCRHNEALRVLRRGEARLPGLLAVGGLPAQFAADVRRAERGQAADELARIVKRLRFLEAAEQLSPTGQAGKPDLPEAEARVLEERGRSIWDRRALLLNSAGARLSPELEKQAQDDLLDLAVLWVNLRVHRASGGQREAARREALAVLSAAEESFGPSAVLARERQVQEGLTGSGAADSDPELAPRSAWEHQAVGRSLLRGGDVQGALAHLERAVAVEPNDFWINFTHGLACYRAGRSSEALAAFHVCVALAPDCAECYFNRALAREALEQESQALADYDHALRLQPGLAAAARNRGLLHFRARRYAEAVADLRKALRLGSDPGPTCYNLALVQEAWGKHAEARESLEQALARDPEHREARALFRRLGGSGVRPAALEQPGDNKYSGK